MRNIYTPLIIVLLIQLTQAATIYLQDFSTSSPTSTEKGALSNDTLYSASTTETINGGDSANLSANGDYSIEINTTVAGIDGYIFNDITNEASSNHDPDGAGFTAFGTDYIFETGNITLTGGAIGSIKLNSNVNTGSEFFSINSIELVEGNIYQGTYIDIDFNYEADIGGNDSFKLTTNFGFNDVTGIDIQLLTGNPTGSDVVGSTVYRHYLIDAVAPEPSALLLLSLGSMTLLCQRRSKRACQNDAE